MQAIAFYFLLPLFYLVSWMPFKLLYLLSDGLYILIFKVFRYRHQVIKENLSNAFPETEEATVSRIQQNFSHNFCDLLVETIKLLTISEKTLKKRVVPGNLEVLERLNRENRTTLLAMGHWGNWEWSSARFNSLDIHTYCAIYHPLSNKYFDGLLFRLRSRFGTRLYSMKDAGIKIMKNLHETTAIAFIADQSPPPENAHWCTFLNQETAVFTGLSRISQKLNLPIVYFSARKVKRGLYEMNAELLIESPNSVTAEEITALYIRRLEKDIRSRPDIWLWTHRRWKHKRPL